MRQKVFVALGCNVAGTWGEPPEALRRAVCELEQIGCHAIQISRIHHTEAEGQLRQPDYLNIVLRARTELPPARLITLFKRIEKAAGRRLGLRNAARPLDIDLIDYGGRVVNWPSPRQRPPLVLPHPETHRRGFVLVPLVQIAPGWRHPVFDLTATNMLRRHRERARGVVARLDSLLDSCNIEG